MPVIERVTFEVALVVDVNGHGDVSRDDLGAAVRAHLEGATLYDATRCDAVIGFVNEAEVRRA